MKNIFSKTLVALSFFTTASYSSFAQVDPVGDFNKHIAENWKSEYIRIGQFRVKGSPYLLGESFDGTITYKGGKVVSDKKVLYDLYNQKAGIEVNKEVFEADAPIESFFITLPEKFGGKKLSFKNSYLYGSSDVKGYLNVLEDGEKLSFFKVYKTRLIPDASNYIIKDLKVFEQYFDYYIYNKSTKTLSAVKLRKKDIAKELNDEEFLKSYIKNNNADLSNEVIVTNLIRSYNSN